MFSLIRNELTLLARMFQILTTDSNPTAFDAYSSEVYAPVASLGHIIQIVD